MCRFLVPQFSHSSQQYPIREEHHYNKYRRWVAEFDAVPGKNNLVLDMQGPLMAALQRDLALEVNNAGIGGIELVQGTEPKYQGRSQS